jgi:glycosyltransferase involved in cell wall biosynthesis
MSDRLPTVDVIVPCYNYGRFLRECVKSVLTQAGVDVRVLIIDDCSSDDSEAVGRQIAAADSRVGYRRHTVNMGHVATYNEGLDWIGGDYCLLLSADDVVTQGALGRAVRLMEGHPEVGMTYGEPIRTDAPDFAGVFEPASYSTEVLSGPTFIENCVRACNNLVEAATAVVRTSVQKAAGGYRKDLPHSCDFEMWLKCASLASVGRVNARQGFYRRHATNMSNGYVHRREYDQTRAALEVFFRDFGHRVPERDRLEAQVRQGLAIGAMFLADVSYNAGHLAQCTDLLREAETLWPDVRRHRCYRRLRLKRALGGRLWRTLRPLLKRDRGPAAVEA